MYDFRKPARQAVRRRWSAEPLEGRALLSALVAGYSADRVDVLELQPSGNDLSHNIASHELPSQVERELQAHFPGATLESAQLDPTSESPYDVHVNWRGLNLEVALSSAGQVLEIDQPVPFAELPPAMREWFAQQFPNAAIRDVVRVTDGTAVSYSVEFVSLNQKTLEVTLRIPDAAGGAVQNSAATPATPATQVSDRGPASAAVSTTSATRTETESTPPRELAARLPNRDARAEDSVASVAVRLSAATLTDSLARSARAATASATAQETVRTISSAGPLMAQALVDVLPLDMAQIERAMRQFLDDVDALLPEAPTGADVLRWTPSLAVAAMTIYGLERIVAERNRAQRLPLLAAGSSRSSWSWVLNLSSWSRSVRRM